MNWLTHGIDWGLFYWNSAIYHQWLAMLHPEEGRKDMLRRVAKEIGSRSVLELCCGPGDLKGWIPANSYHGIDKNPAFVEPLARRSLSIQKGDVMMMDWPKAECLVMVDSLYHFLGCWDAFISMVEEYPCETVILSEPVENVLSRVQPWLVGIGSWVTRVDGQYYPERFTERRLRHYLSGYAFQTIFRQGRHCIAVWDKRPTR